MSNPSGRGGSGVLYLLTGGGGRRRLSSEGRATVSGARATVSGGRGEGRSLLFSLPGDKADCSCGLQPHAAPQIPNPPTPARWGLADAPVSAELAGRFLTTQLRVSSELQETEL